MALHGLWFLLLAPPVGWAVRRWPPTRLRRAGAALMWLGVLAIVGVIVHDSMTCILGPLRNLEPTRIFFVLLKQGEVPVFQLPLAGAVCWAAGKVRGSRATAAPRPEAAEPEDAQVDSDPGEPATPPG